jgi:hypothetical protein
MAIGTGDDEIRIVFVGQFAQVGGIVANDQRGHGNGRNFVSLQPGRSTHSATTRLSTTCVTLGMPWAAFWAVRRWRPKQ